MKEVMSMIAKAKMTANAGNARSGSKHLHYSTLACPSLIPCVRTLSRWTGR